MRWSRLEGLETKGIVWVRVCGRGKTCLSLLCVGCVQQLAWCVMCCEAGASARSGVNPLTCLCPRCRVGRNYPPTTANDCYQLPSPALVGVVAQVDAEGRPKSGRRDRRVGLDSRPAGDDEDDEEEGDEEDEEGGCGVLGRPA